jgi:hypothetical protein
MKEAAHAMAVRPGLVRFDMDAGQTPIAPFYRPGKLGLVGLPCLLQAPDCGAVLVESAPGSMAGFAERAAECQARGKTWWSYFDLTDEFPTRPDGLVENKPGVRHGRMRWRVQQVTPVPSLTAKEPRLAGLSRYDPTSNTQHPTSNIQHPTSNIQHPTSNIQHPTSNIQHPTSNIQHPTEWRFVQTPTCSVIPSPASTAAFACSSMPKWRSGCLFCRAA